MNVKRSPSLWLHNKSCLWKQADLVFHWCLYNKQNSYLLAYGYEFYLLVFIPSGHIEWSTRYLNRSLPSLVRYRVDHSKIKFVSMHGHVISSIYLYCDSYVMNSKHFSCNLNKCMRHQVSREVKKKFGSTQVNNLQIRLRVRVRVRVRVFQCVPGAHAWLCEAVTSTRSVVKFSSPSWHQLRHFRQISSPDYEFTTGAKASEKVSL